MNTNPEAAYNLQNNVLMPAILSACKEAEAKGEVSGVDIVNALVNTHAAILSQILGREAAVSLMRDHLAHMEKVLLSEKQALGKA